MSETYAHACEIAREILGASEDRRAELMAERCADDGILAHKVRLCVEHAEAAERDGFLTSIGKSGRQQIIGGDFLLIGQIGSGGMGVVYRAWQGSLEREVALKLIRTGAWASREERQRFRLESHLAANLNHPHFITIYDFGEEEDALYCAMELVDGHSLADELKTGPLAPDEAATIVQRMATAIEHVHQHRVLHRDLKPSNVMLARAGKDDGNALNLRRNTPHAGRYVPKIIDLGLATRTEFDPIGKTLAMTQTGHILGSPPYMPPEQAAAKANEIDERSDVYALGATLYHLLCGRAPFTGESAFDIIQQVIHNEPVPLRRIDAKIPRDLETIVSKCLEKSPGRRYGNATSLAADLGRYLSGVDVLARPIGRIETARRWVRQHKKTSVAGAITFLVLLVIAFGQYARQKGKEADTARGGELAAREQAGESKREAADEKKKAVAANKLAVKERREKTIKVQIVEAQTLADRARKAMPKFPQRAVLLATEAVLMGASAGIPIPSADQALRDALTVCSGFGFARHPDAVTCLVISPDDRWVATGCADGTTRLWKTSVFEKSRAKPIVLTGHEGAVTRVAFSRDGNWLATGGADATVRLWERRKSNTFAAPRLLNAHRGPVRAVAFSPNGRWLVTAAQRRNNAICVWDLQAPGNVPPVVKLKGHSTGTLSIAIGTGSRRFVTGGGDLTVRVWTLPPVADAQPIVISDRRARHLPEGNTTGNVSHLAMTPDGQQVVSACSTRDPAVYLTTLGRVRRSKVLNKHTKPVWAMAMSRDGKWLATGSQDSTVRYWDLRNAKQKHEFRHGGAVLSVAVSPNGRWLAAGGLDQTVRMWDLKAPKPAETEVVFRGHESGVRHLAFTKDSYWLVGSALKDHTVRVWDLGTRSVSSSSLVLHATKFGVMDRVLASSDGRWIIGHQRYATANRKNGRATVYRMTYLWGIPDGDRVRLDPPADTFIFSPDSKWVATGHRDGDVRLWSLMGKSVAKSSIRLVGHAGEVTAACFGPKRRWLATGGRDRLVRLWDLAAPDKRRPIVLRGHTADVRSLAWSPNGKWLASGSSDKTARIWQLNQTGATEAGVLPGHVGPVKIVAFCDDGRQLATLGDRLVPRPDAATKHVVRIWNLAQPDPSQSPQVLGGHTDVIQDMAISPDGKWLVTASDDKTARLWNLTKNPTTTSFVLLGHEDPLNVARFSADSRWLATGGGKLRRLKDASIRLWDLTFTDPRAAPIVLNGHTRQIRDVAILPINLAASASDDGTIRIWPMRKKSLFDQASRAAGRNFSKREWQQFFLDAPYRRTFPSLKGEF